MAAATLVEQRLFCFTLAKHVSQHEVGANPRDGADRLFLWCQGKKEPEVAFKSLHTITEMRTGRMTINMMLQLAEEAYSFALNSVERAAPEVGREVRVAERQSGRKGPSTETPRVGPKGKKFKR